MKMIALKMKKVCGKRTSGVRWLATEGQETNANLPVNPGIGRVNNVSPHGRSLMNISKQERRQDAKQMVASGKRTSGV